MTRVVFLNTTISWNKGAAAQVASIVDALSNRIPGAKFSTISYCLNLDKPWADEYGVEVVGYPDDKEKTLGQALRRFSFRLTFSLSLAILARIMTKVNVRADFAWRERFCGEILASDVVIDLSGDSMSDRGSHSVVNLLAILMAIVLGRPVVSYSQSIGPFSRLMIPFSRFVLNRVSRISVREDFSRHYLSSIDIRKDKVVVHGDCAFNLRPAPSERVREILRAARIPEDGSTLIGVSISSFMIDFYSCDQSKTDMRNRYVECVTSIVKMLAEIEGTRIVLVPHVVSPKYWSRDDRWACDLVSRLVSNPGKVHTLTDDYSASELKAVIGECKFFVGSRMHACIAALSQSIPTVALGWSHKYWGIMKRLGQNELVVEFSDHSRETVLSIIHEAFQRRVLVAEGLYIKVEAEKKSALEGIDVIIDASNPH
jgi:colanic acid/amylovoran biosynthesis protein